ncbi:DUF5693 family protein [Candidatus Caldatribacterium saccharofermentans]|uniref:DUF5693 family protein n=1 Tax=Candidatus Caldatribacterium saccharofermentans TaxID=1454753 RepID=UPI003D07ACE3
MPGRRLLVLLSIVVLAAALPFALERVARERENRSVLLVVDWDDLEWFARTKGVDPLVLARELRQEGFTVFGVSEWSLKALKARGLLVPAPAPPDAPPYLQYFTGASEAVRKTLAERLNTLGKRVEVFGEVLGVSLLPEEEEKVGLGWDRDLIQRLREEGCTLVLRPYNYLNVPPEVLSRLLGDDVWKNEGVVGVIASGDSIPGYGNPQSLRRFADFLSDRGLFFGYVEFVGQKGEDTLARLVPQWTLRVHSIPPDELKNYTPETARERFLRALRERSVRVLYLRLFTEPSFTGWERNFVYLQDLRKDIQAQGLAFGLPPLPHRAFAPSRAFLVLSAFVVSFFALFLFEALFFRPPLWLGFLGGVLLSVVVFTSPLWGMKVVGLCAGVTAPTLSVMLLVEEFSQGRKFRGILEAFLVAFAGSLVIAQGLYHWLFVQRIEQYFGVKVMLTFPVVLVFLYLFRRRLLGGSLQEVLLGDLRRFELLVAAFLGVAFVLYLTRSGNFPLLGAGRLENQMRTFLERILFARPRTKEFLVGYPALWLLASLRDLRPVYRMVLWLSATVGFVTMVNSFCHLHTPLLFTLLRFANALSLSVPVFGVYYLAVLFALWIWRTVGRWGA